jgi:hypothetical protein
METRRQPEPDLFCGPDQSTQERIRLPDDATPASEDRHLCGADPTDGIRGEVLGNFIFIQDMENCICIDRMSTAGPARRTVPQQGKNNR